MTFTRTVDTVVVFSKLSQWYTDVRKAACLNKGEHKEDRTLED